ncbi:dTMP kinase [Piscicoccus intestinalis]|uniref:dTMP kinase n=1 Tax=Piscicoccus intestinalis TaxID=746033 RepID=UPI000A071B76|nr:dTMP kinase [Piscicoccus intestinalis]
MPTPVNDDAARSRAQRSAAAVPDDAAGGPAGGSSGPEGDTGLFVVFEGGDGAGKSTQAALLSQWLGEQGIDHVLTREPGGTALGQRLREVLLHGSDGLAARAEALLFAADRAEHVERVIIPALDSGRWVVCDRYVDSSIAYQGGGRDLDVRQIGALSRWATAGLVPDLTVLLDVPVAVGAARRQGPADRMESESVAFHEQVAQRFRDQALRARDRYVVLDATRPPQELARAVREKLAQIIEAPAPGLRVVRDGSARAGSSSGQGGGSGSVRQGSGSSDGPSGAGGGAPERGRPR